LGYHQGCKLHGAVFTGALHWDVFGLVNHVTVVHLEHPKLTFAYICDYLRLPGMMLMMTK
jgi:hypothetical protein